MDDTNSTSQPTSTNRQSDPDSTDSSTDTEEGQKPAVGRTVDLRSEEADAPPGQNEQLSEEMEARLAAAAEAGAVSPLDQYDVGDETVRDIDAIANTSVGARGTAKAPATATDDQPAADQSAETSEQDAETVPDTDRPDASTPPETAEFPATGPEGTQAEPEPEPEPQTASSPPSQQTPKERLEDLQSAYAAGEITDEQYEERLDSLVDSEAADNVDLSSENATAPDQNTDEGSVPSTDDEEWTWGKRKADETHEYRGMTVRLSEPEDDDAFINAQREAAQVRRKAGLTGEEASDDADIDGSTAMAANKPLVQLIVQEPEITDERWENKMTPMDRWNVTLLVTQYLQRDDGGFTSASGSGQSRPQDS